MSDKRIVDFAEFKRKKLNDKIYQAKLDDFYRAQDESSEFAFILDFVDCLEDHDLDSLSFMCQKYDATFNIHMNSEVYGKPYAVHLDLDPNLYQYTLDEIFVFVSSGFNIPMCMNELAGELKLYYNYLMQRGDE